MTIGTAASERGKIVEDSSTLMPWLHLA